MDLFPLQLERRMTLWLQKKKRKKIIKIDSNIKLNQTDCLVEQGHPTCDCWLDTVSVDVFLRLLIYDTIIVSLMRVFIACFWITTRHVKKAGFSMTATPTSPPPARNSRVTRRTEQRGQSFDVMCVIREVKSFTFQWFTWQPLLYSSPGVNNERIYLLLVGILIF